MRAELCDSLVGEGDLLSRFLSSSTLRCAALPSPVPMPCCAGLFACGHCAGTLDADNPNYGTNCGPEILNPLGGERTLPYVDNSFRSLCNSFVSVPSVQSLLVQRFFAIIWVFWNLDSAIKTRAKKRGFEYLAWVLRLSGS